jgi:pyruvate/2-oxoglutarate dehydrogenase complex dihydrolipoamide acyltransferase (E2) component
VEGDVPHYVILPQVGESCPTASIVGWKNREDGVVHAGDPIVEMETGKAIFDLYAEVDGVLVWQVFSPRCTVTVGEVVAVIALSGEDAAAVQSEAKRRFPPKAAPPVPSSFARLFRLRS